MKINNDPYMYHGGDTRFTIIEPKYMLLDTSNAQEGIGIYFGNYATASSYGKYVMRAKLDKRKFVASDAFLGDSVDLDDLVKLLKVLQRKKAEEFFYTVSDWVYVETEDDVTDDKIVEYAEQIHGELMGYFTTDLAMRFGVETFVKAWNKHIPYVHGTYTKEYGGYFAVMNTNYKLDVI